MCREQRHDRHDEYQEADYSDEEDADIDVGIGDASDSSDEETEPQVSLLSMCSVLNSMPLQQQESLLIVVRIYCSCVMVVSLLIAQFFQRSSAKSTVPFCHGA